MKKLAFWLLFFSATISKSQTGEGVMLDLIDGSTQHFNWTKTTKQDSTCYVTTYSFGEFQISLTKDSSKVICILEAPSMFNRTEYSLSDDFDKEYRSYRSKSSYYGYIALSFEFTTKEEKYVKINSFKPGRYYMYFKLE